MGAHTSFPLVIYHLVTLKSHFRFIIDPKYQEVVQELSTYEVNPTSDNLRD
jgi:hypothetical protein